MSPQTESMPRLEWLWDEQNRTKALVAGAALILTIADAPSKESYQRAPLNTRETEVLRFLV